MNKAVMLTVIKGFNDLARSKACPSAAEVKQLVSLYNLVADRKIIMSFVM